MRIVITGATSFVGAASVRELLRRGHEAAAVVRPGTKNLAALTAGNGAAISDGRLKIIENDLGEPEKLPEKIASVWDKRPAGALADVFCHFGWGGSGSSARTDQKLQEKNLKDSLNTVRAAGEMGCGRFLFSGSQAEYGLHAEQMTEETACAPRSFYGEAKLMMREQGEALCRELDIGYVHGRIFSAYGPGDHPWTLVETCIDRFLSGEEMVLGACSQQWNFLYIDDLARAVAALAELPKERIFSLENPVFNLAGNDTRRLSSFVETIHRLCGLNGVCRFGSRPENAEGLVNLIPDIEKIRSVCGWEPEISFETGITRLIAQKQGKH